MSKKIYRGMHCFM